MAARARANGRAPSAAAKRTAAKQARYETEMRAAVQHFERIQAERRHLGEQREAIVAREEQLKDAAAQLQGRVSTLRELRGEIPPLPELQIEPTPAPGSAEA